MTEHEHRFDLQLGPDGHGLIYGAFEGYVRRCKCGEYAPDVVACIQRRRALKLEEARRLLAEEGAR